MGLEIQLQDERGGMIESVIDSKNLLPDLLPSEEKNDSHPMLSGIDLYGDTVFKRIQMPRFLSEWANVVAAVRTQEEQALVSEIERLARRCSTDVHQYLKFIGY
jgi:hypothetical protein